MQGIHPFLWFDGKAEEAANFYVSLFPNSRILIVTRVPEGLPPMVGKAGNVLTVEFELDGQRFVALNGSPEIKFNQAVSFLVACDTQAEIDRFWDALTSDGGQPIQCGWLQDKYGLSWQITPAKFGEWMQGTPAQTLAYMNAMMQMVKLDLATLEEAYENAA